MSGLKIEKHKWQPSCKDETHITDDQGNESFIITLKQGEDIEIDFDWDHGYGGRGSAHTSISVKLLKELLKDLG